MSDILILRYILSYFKKYQQDYESDEFKINFMNFDDVIDFTIYKNNTDVLTNILFIRIEIIDDIIILTRFLDIEDNTLEFILDENILEELDETEIILRHGRELLDKNILSSFEPGIQDKILEYIQDIR